MDKVNTTGQIDKLVEGLPVECSRELFRLRKECRDGLLQQIVSPSPALLRKLAESDSGTARLVVGPYPKVRSEVIHSAVGTHYPLVVVGHTVPDCRGRGYKPAEVGVLGYYGAQGLRGYQVVRMYRAQPWHRDLFEMVRHWCDGRVEINKGVTEGTSRDMINWVDILQELENYLWGYGFPVVVPTVLVGAAVGRRANNGLRWSVGLDLCRVVPPRDPVDDFVSL